VLSRNALLSLGVLALLAGGLLVVMWFRQPDISLAPATRQIPTQSILVAARSIPAGTLLRPGDMTWGDVPAAEVVGADIVRSTLTETEFAGAVTRHAFAVREPLTDFGLVKPGDSEFLVAALAPGLRAVSISVDATQSTSGLALPGDRVDVLLTQSFLAPGTDAGHKSVSETVLRDLRVIAIDQALRPIPNPTVPLPPGSELKMPKTVTLEVTDRQAAMLLVAEQIGKIQLALRGQRDQTVAPPPEPLDVAPVWASDVSPALEPPPVTPVTGLPAVGPTPAAPTVLTHAPIEVIHGAKIERRCDTSAGLVACP
jgi:pilus assembly protein CpaB